MTYSRTSEGRAWIVLKFDWNSLRIGDAVLVHGEPRAAGQLVAATDDPGAGRLQDGHGRGRSAEVLVAVGADDERPFAVDASEHDQQAHGRCQ